MVDYNDEDPTRLFVLEPGITKLKIKMEESFTKLHEASEKYECTFRDASYIVALKKLEDTYQSRGLI